MASAPSITSTADYVRFTRAALASGGFRRNSIEGTVYWTAGEGRPLVLVHGANDQAGSWFAVAPRLAGSFHVVLPDLPGHGESEPAEGELPVELLLARLDAVIDDALSPEGSLAIGGNSLGGWLAIRYVLAHAGRVRHLLLENSGGLDRPFEIDLVATTADDARRLLRAAHGRSFEPQPWQIEGLIARSVDSPMLRITGSERFYVDARLGEIRCPTTILWGEEDGIIPLDYADALRRGIEGATLHVIPGAAHIPHLQKPAEFLSLVTEVLE